MKSDKINQAIRRLDRVMLYKDKWTVRGLEGTGKCIPYIGWCWRDVDWGAREITLGVLPPDFVGFMQSNKWDYKQFSVIGEAKDKLQRMVEQSVVRPTNEKFQALFDYIQSLCPVGLNKEVQ